MNVVVMMSYPTCKCRAVARVVMVGVLGVMDCTCSFDLALVCCVGSFPLLHRLFIAQRKAQQRLEVERKAKHCLVISDWRYRGRPSSNWSWKGRPRIYLRWRGRPSSDCK